MVDFEYTPVAERLIALPKAWPENVNALLAEQASRLTEQAEQIKQMQENLSYLEVEFERQMKRLKDRIVGLEGGKRRTRE